MIGRAMALTGVLGTVLVHKLSTLPDYKSLLLYLGLSLLFLLISILLPCAHKKIFIFLGFLILAFILSFTYTSLLAQQRLHDQLEPINVDKVSRVTLRVVGLPKVSADRVSFIAKVIDSHPVGVPAYINVGWSAGGWRGPYTAPEQVDLPTVYAGQVWRMALILRPVSASQNMNLFDYEAYSFAAGVRALGTVRGNPEFIRNDNWHDLATVANRARHLVRNAMAPYIKDLRYGPVLRALAIGDQDGVDDADWLVFNRSGLTHLVSISGSHITMLSGAVAILVYFIWCRLRWRNRVLAEYWPARRAAACVAMLVAWVYSLLAGWEIPAQRTFMMLAVVAVAQALQLRISGSRVLALAAVIVILFDPWAVLASGFWLSFIAVGVLLAVSASLTKPNSQQFSDNNLRPSKLELAVRLQLAVTFALAPALAWIFNEVSVVSPLANSYAIPGIELLVTPLSLLLAVVSLIPGGEFFAGILAWLAHSVLQLIMIPTEWLASLPTLNVPTGPAWLYLLASAGVVIALWPQPKYKKAYLGWLAMLPMVLWSPDKPKDGEWQMYALDVGQGSAILLQTAKHSFLFDAGPRNSIDSDQGVRVIVPFLRALGIKKLDVLIASHADLDHVGGVRSVLQAVPVEQSYSSFALASWLGQESKKLGSQDTYIPLADNYCIYGESWYVDGVSFEFLWPLDTKPKRSSKESNGASCVLRVMGKYHSLLLTGDIDAKTELVLVDRGLTKVDVVLAAHHGSNTSSSAEFVTTAMANHVIMQVGRWNRYSHPHPKVINNWHQAKTKIWRTDMHGGVNAISRSDGLQVYSVINKWRRYWHGRIS